MATKGAEMTLHWFFSKKMPSLMGKVQHPLTDDLKLA